MLTHLNLLQIRRYSKVEHQISRKVQGADAYRCNKLEYGSCVCTGDYPLADALGLSSRTNVQTILNYRLLHFKYSSKTIEF